MLRERKRSQVLFRQPGTGPLRSPVLCLCRGYGAEGGKLVNKYKAYCESDKVNIVNIQKNTDGASVIYITFPVAVSSTTAEEAKIEGAGVGFPVDSVKEFI